MPLVLILALIVVPLAELYVLIQVGHALGVLPTIALLLLDSIVGAALLRREGRRAWRALRQALEERRLPAREVADGALVVFGGALLLTPGFLTDVLGLLCILPLTRGVLRSALTRIVAGRFGVPGGPGARGGRGARDVGGGAAARPTSPSVLDGEVVEPQKQPGPPPVGERPW